MSGQTLNDRLTAARHALAGQGLARIVCKATTEEVIGPKKKHLDYLLHCTNEPNVSIPQLANLLIERTQNTSWVVVFKALITVHHLMCYGNERFTQYLASSNCTFQLGHFLDKVGVQSYDMSTFIRRYAKYLNEKAVSYRSVAFDFCKCKRGKEDGVLRQMNTEQLLKTLPALQNQLDSLLEFDCSANDLCNGVVNSCFMLLFRDLIRLFACYNDGIINLLEKYFEMNKKHARDALDIYKKFLIRMDRVAEFLKVAEAVGIDKGEIPDLTRAPSSLLEALEQHLATLEGRKGSTSAASAAVRAANVQNAVTVLSHTSNAFGSAGDSTSPHQEINGIKVDENVQKALEEEAQVMTELKFDHDSPLLWEQPAWEDSERRMKEIGSSDFTSPPSGVTKTNPFLASPSEPTHADTTPTSNQKILDLFNSSTLSPNENIEGRAITPASDDLLCLNNNLSSNPFADIYFDAQPKQSQPQQQQQQQQQQDSFMAFTNGFGTSSSDAASAFASDASFAAAFGDTPTPTSGGFDAFGNVQPPMATAPARASDKTSSSSGILKGDLDSTLANLASNLDINGPKTSFKKGGGHQWGSPKPPAKAAAAGGWTAPVAGAPLAGATQWGASPQHVMQPMTGNSPSQWSGAFPQVGAPNISPQPVVMGGNIQPNMGVMGSGFAVPQKPAYGGFPPQVPLVPSANPGLPTQNATVNDPFGAL